MSSNTDAALPVDTGSHSPAYIPSALRHLPWLGALFVLHLAIYARIIFATSEGAPYAIVHWDFILQYYLWLVYIGDCFQAHIFPFWCPYAAAGTPFFLNPQNQLFSPPTLLIGWLFGYSERIAQLQEVFTIYFGGIGAYLLAYSLWRSRWAALISAICFSFSSTMFSHLEHMTTINAYSLIPWLFFTTTLTARRRPWSFPALAFFISCIITAGYPAITAMTLLWLGAYTAYLAWGMGPPLRYLLTCALAWLLGLALAAVHWIPILAHLGDFSRGAPLGIDAALNFSLSFKHLWGMFFLFMTEHPLPGKDTDIALRGIYFGALALPLALSTLLLRKERVVSALFLLSTCAFLMACGGDFFLRFALHLWFPVFNFSQFPAQDSRMFLVLGMSLLAGGSARMLREGDPRCRTLLLRCCAGLLVVLAAGLGLLAICYDRQTYFNVVLKCVSAEMIAVGIFMVCLCRFSGRTILVCAIAVLSLEAGTAVIANFLVVGERVTKAGYAVYEQRHRKEFTVHDVHAPRIAEGRNMDATYSNTSYADKKFHLDHYNSFRLRRLDKLLQSGFKDWMTRGERVVALPPEGQPADFANFKDLMKPVAYEILDYLPNQVSYQVSVPARSLLVFNEVYFPGWRASVDGVEQQMSDVCGGLRGLIVTAGSHHIVTTFHPRWFYPALAVSAGALLLVLFWLGWALLRRGEIAAPEQIRACRTGSE